MSLRDILLKGISMKLRGASRGDIFSYILRMARQLGGIKAEGDENSFVVRLIATGATISFDGSQYACRTR